MATLQIRLENGHFTEFEGGRYLETLEPTHMVGNGWDCTIQEGTLTCAAIREYSDGNHAIVFKVNPNGFAVTTLTTPQEKKVLKKGFVVPKGVKFGDGVLGLAGGNIDCRYAYFRDASFQAFLKKYGITAVEHKDPNQAYNLREALYGGGVCATTIWTDGHIEKGEPDFGRTFAWKTQSPGTCASEVDQVATITDATWAVYERDVDEYDNHCHIRKLITLANPTNLVGLPEK